MTRKTIPAILAALVLLSSCGEKKGGIGEHRESEIKTINKFHQWFYFTPEGIEKTDLPQHAPMKMEKPWTEALRISSMANGVSAAEEFSAFGILNRGGVLCFKGEEFRLFRDEAMFPGLTADSIVFSDGKPVFYLYRSTFFSDPEEPARESPVSPFLVEFDPATKICFPLVSYENLHLTKESSVTSFLWDGVTWACSAKRNLGDGVEFSYFKWQPLVPLVDLTPATGDETFIFKKMNEDEFKKLSMPEIFDRAGPELKNLLAPVPEKISFYISWRDEKGWSARSFFQEGENTVPLNAKAQLSPLSGHTLAVFADGTIYTGTKAFRLPKLPAGFTYGEFCVSEDTLYVAWEETNFYLTGRSGFIQVDLKGVLES